MQINALEVTMETTKVANTIGIIKITEIVSVTDSSIFSFSVFCNHVTIINLCGNYIMIPDMVRRIAFDNSDTCFSIINYIENSMLKLFHVRVTMPEIFCQLKDFPKAPVLKMF